MVKVRYLGPNQNSVEPKIMHNMAVIHRSECKWNAELVYFGTRTPLRATRACHKYESRDFSPNIRGVKR